jgi:hypothetical protein
MALGIHLSVRVRPGRVAAHIAPKRTRQLECGTGNRLGQNLSPNTRPSEQGPPAPFQVPIEGMVAWRPEGACRAR